MRHSTPSLTALAALTACALLLGCERAAPPQTTPAPTEVAAPVVTAPASTPEPTTPQDHSDGPVTRFRATGFSPAWTAEVDGDTIGLEVPETAGPDSTLKKTAVTRSAYAKGVNYDGTLNGVAFTLDVRSGPCTRTGDSREFTATLTYGKQTYHGCADALR